MTTIVPNKIVIVPFYIIHESPEYAGRKVQIREYMKNKYMVVVLKKIERKFLFFKYHTWKEEIVYRAKNYKIAFAIYDRIIEDIILKGGRYEY